MRFQIIDFNTLEKGNHAFQEIIVMKLRALIERALFMRCSRVVVIRVIRVIYLEFLNTQNSWFLIEYKPSDTDLVMRILG